MKKLITLSAVVAFTTVFIGCGGSETEDLETAPDEIEEGGEPGEDAAGGDE